MNTSATTALHCAQCGRPVLTFVWVGNLVYHPECTHGPGWAQETYRAPPQTPPEAKGTAVVVDGALVAWFAEPDEHAEDFCRTNWYGRWLAWRSIPPQLIPLTPDEQAKCEAAGKELAAKLRGMDDAQAAKGKP